MTVEPERLEVDIGDTVEFRCHVTGSRYPRLEWSRDVGDLPVDALVRDGLLRFRASEAAEQGRYECRVLDDDGATIATAAGVLIIRLGFSRCCCYSSIMSPHNS